MRTIPAFLFVVALFLTFNANAQLANEQEVLPNQFGIKAGINASQFYGGESSAKNESIFGYHGGAFARFMLSQNFAFQPELLYTTKGNVSPSPGSIKISTQYIVLDLLAKYYITNHLNVHVGPELGFLVEADTQYDRDPLDPLEEDVSEAFEDFDFALIVGVELHLNERLSLGLRYNPSLISSGTYMNEKFDFTDQKNTALLLFGTFAF